MEQRIVRSIKIDTDGVYLLQKLSEHVPYGYVKDDALTKAYQLAGQKGLDCKFVEMLFDDSIELRALHSSTKRFLPCLEKGLGIYNRAISEIDSKIFQLIIDGDYSITYPPEKHSEAAKACNQYVNDTMKAAYERIAQFADPLNKMRDTGAR